MKNTLDESAYSGIQVLTEDAPAEAVTLLDFQTIRDFERLYKPEQLARAVFIAEYESVVIRRPLWWTKDGERIPDSCPDMDLEELCQINKWKMVAQYGNHFAVVAPEELE